jgi:hypothetical protein
VTNTRSLVLVKVQHKVLIRVHSHRLRRWRCCCWCCRWCCGGGPSLGCRFCTPACGCCRWRWRCGLLGHRGAAGAAGPAARSHRRLARGAAAAAAAAAAASTSARLCSAAASASASASRCCRCCCCCCALDEAVQMVVEHLVCALIQRHGDLAPQRAADEVPAVGVPHLCMCARADTWCGEVVVCAMGGCGAGDAPCR